MDFQVYSIVRGRSLRRRDPVFRVEDLVRAYTRWERRLPWTIPSAEASAEAMTWWPKHSLDTREDLVRALEIARTLSLLDDVWRSQINSLDKTIASWSTPGQIPRQAQKPVQRIPRQAPSSYVFQVLQHGR